MREEVFACLALKIVQFFAFLILVLFIVLRLSIIIIFIHLLTIVVAYTMQLYDVKYGEEKNFTSNVSFLLATKGSN